MSFFSYIHVTHCLWIIMICLFEIINLFEISFFFSLVYAIMRSAISDNHIFFVDFQKGFFSVGNADEALDMYNEHFVKYSCL